MENIPIKDPAEISGDDFCCAKQGLTSLKGAPNDGRHIDEFDCSYNQLTSLKYAPPAACWFNCSHNQLTSLKYISEILFLDCSYNRLTSLEGISEMDLVDLNCYDNCLTSLKGCPEFICEHFVCGKNAITSLKGSPTVEEFSCQNCFDLVDISDLSSHCEKIDIAYCNKIEKFPIVLGHTLRFYNPTEIVLERIKKIYDILDEGSDHYYEGLTNTIIRGRYFEVQSKMIGQSVLDQL